MKVRLSVFIGRLFMASGPRAHYRTGQVLRKLSLLFCCLILLCPLALPQEISGTYSVERSKAQVIHLLYLLKSKNMQDAVKCFFGEGVLYDRDLADLLVFIDKTERHELSDPCLSIYDSSKIALLKRGIKRTDLFGEKFLYLMVFVAEKATDPYSVGKNISESAKPEIAEEQIEKITERSPLSVWQSSLDYKVGSGEFFLISMVKTILKVIPGGASIDSSKQTEQLIEIKNQPLKMACIGCTKDKDNKDEDNIFLYYGYMRLVLVENTINRFTVNETLSDKKSSDNKIYYHLATFGNYSSSIIGSSMGFTGTYMKSKQREQLDDARFPINAFFFGHLYIKRPRLPTPHHPNSTFPRQIVRRFSLSLACGTALKTDLLDDLFVGIGVGHLFGALGIVAGYNFRTEAKTIGDITEKKRKPHFCVGINFAL